MVQIQFLNPGLLFRFRRARALAGVVFVYGIIAVITGLSDIVFWARAELYTGFSSMISIISGVFSIMAGIMLIAYPGTGKWVMVLLLPIWFIAHCIFLLTQLHWIRAVAGRFCYTFSLVANIIGIILVCLMIVWPSLSLFPAGILIGAYLILLGADKIIMSMSFRDFR